MIAILWKNRRYFILVTDAVQPCQECCARCRGNTVTRANGVQMVLRGKAFCNKYKLFF